MQRSVSFLINLLVLIYSAAALPGAQTNDFLNDTRGGHWLAQTKGLGVWWCESGWKVGRERGLPDKPRGKPEPVSVSAARGSIEPVQVVLRPEKDGAVVVGGGESVAQELGQGGAHFGPD